MSPKPPGIRRRSMRLTLALSVGAFVSVTACQNAKTAVEQAPVREVIRTVTFSAEQVQHGAIRWATVKPVTMTSTVETPGQLLPNEDRTARLSAPARGRLVAVHVNVGDRVSAGQALVTLQSQEATAARADYFKAVAELRSRQAAANYARGARERAERLLDLKATSRQEVERARTDDELAQGAQTEAQAEVERAQASLTHLGVDGSGDMVLRTPLAGVVLRRDAAPGSVVDAGAPLLIVADIRTLWLQAAATEALATTLRPGVAMQFSVPAFPDQKFKARIQNVGAALDPATRTLLVRALVQNPSGRLRPEMFATVLIGHGEARSGVAVPDGAIQLLDERPVVFIARPDDKGGALFERRDVEVGAKAGGQVHIVKGLGPGDRVVTEGAFAVKSEFARTKIPSES
jgi:cobalt-zinc-cadmium efflux system membrane fusion protein